MEHFCRKNVIVVLGKKWLLFYYVKVYFPENPKYVSNYYVNNYVWLIAQNHTYINECYGMYFYRKKSKFRFNEKYLNFKKQYSQAN
jgi:hypothetical protein